VSSRDDTSGSRLDARLKRDSKVIDAANRAV
jgi:hypothetical protein